MELTQLWSSFAGIVTKVLPLSPFAEFYANWEAPEWLGWLNWVFPVGLCCRTLAAWAGAIGVYYLYTIILRWLKVIA